MKRKAIPGLSAAVLSAGAVLWGCAARADIIPVFNADTSIGNACEFSYNVSVAQGSRVNRGDYFTIYDFNGYIASSAFAPANWTITTQNVGLTPAGVDPNAFSGDNPNVVNLTFKYNGASALFGPSLIGGTGAFGADSTNCDLHPLGTYASMAHKNNPGHGDNNTRQANGGFLVTPAAVPEGSSLMLLGTGLVPLGLVLRRRSK